MRVLVACEFSGIVRDAFAALGHDAWSCDPLIARNVQSGWAIMRSHPPCTTTCSSTVPRMWLEAQLAALHFVRALWKFPVPAIAIENPIGRLSTLWRGPDQIIQPYQFGDPYKKATCLWLKNLPPLVATDDLGDGKQACWLEGPSPARKMNRARTYQGIAAAMAKQWSEHVDEFGLTSPDRRRRYA